MWKPEWSAEDRKQIGALVIEIGERVSALQALRKELGLSQVELAKILNMTQSNVSKLEAGRDVRLATLKTLIESRGGHMKVVAEFNGREIELAL
ncbi:MAG: helix-turn-helix domain-containing protein [Brevundimonas sp.]|uniref:helix-turn-helix domain-containing protein n=1 Tax=Brevundimonas sp. TaxID=1871086 RepID=UPI0024898FE6|nr:helix-turn-helix domain-containing protein [Brevundimonas sp.]MDI1326259.1 helix-turn-helix domain-containing protein [Brevundimonas sp.]